MQSLRVLRRDKNRCVLIYVTLIRQKPFGVELKIKIPGGKVSGNSEKNVRANSVNY